MSGSLNVKRGLGAASAVAVLGGVALFAGLPAGEVAANSPAAAAPQATPASVATVEQRDVATWAEFSGRLEAVGRVEVRPRVAGQVTAVHFQEGALVKKGDPLFTIDPEPFAAEVERLKAEVGAAQARATLARNDLNRGRQLTQLALSARDLDARESGVREAEATQKAAEAALRTAQLNLQWTEVRAPIDGRVGKIEVTEGNIVGAGPNAPVLTRLVSVSPVYASFDADEATVTKALDALPKGRDEIADIPVEMALDGRGSATRGRLQYLDPSVDPAAGTVRVRAVFDNADGRLMPGQFARLRLGQAKAEPAVLVSERAVGVDQDKKYVLVIGADDKAIYREVTLGQTSGGLRIVTSGLEPGERVVVNGLQKLRPGALVAPQPVAMDGAAAAEKQASAK